MPIPFPRSPLAPPATRRVLACAALAAVTAFGFAGAAAPPEPDPTPTRWQLDIEPGPLRVATVRFRGEPRTYFFMTYTVMNNSGTDLLFAPSFEIANDSQVLRSGRDVPLEVTRTLIESVQNPLVEDQISIIGQLLQGKENARDGIVIWPATELAPDTLTIYAAGFSGETATVPLPSDPDQKVVLRKTLMLRYRISGNVLDGGSSRVGLPLAEPPRWIMR